MWAQQATVKQGPSFPPRSSPFLKPLRGLAFSLHERRRARLGNTRKTPGNKGVCGVAASGAAEWSRPLAVPPEAAPRRLARSPLQASQLRASAAKRTGSREPPPRSAAAPPRRAAPQARLPPGGRRSGASAPRGPPRQNKGMRGGGGEARGPPRGASSGCPGARLGLRSQPSTARRVPGPWGASEGRNAV